MNKVAIYCRLSDEDKNKKSYEDYSESIQNQKNLLVKYAMEKEWNIYNIYADDDYSGLDSERPEFNTMIKEAEEGKFNIILCKTQSRFTRDMEFVERFLHNKFIEWGIRFVTVVDGVDTLDKHNKKSRQINGLVNEWYCEEVSESIKSVFRMKQKSGKFIGSFPSYGYTKDPKDHNALIIDEEAAEVVRMIFTLYLKGNGTQQIASILNKKDIPNPTKYKQLKGLRYKVSCEDSSYGFWNKTTIKRILKNQYYIGNMVQHRRKKVNYKSKKILNVKEDDWIVVKDTHKPIIDEETFLRVQKRLKSNIKSSGKGKPHLFAGKVKCKDCKSSLHRMSNGKYSYLRCKLYVKDPSKKLCTSHSIKLEVLEKVVSEKIKNHIKSICDTESIASSLFYNQNIEKKIKLLNSKISKTDREIEKSKIVLKNLYLDKINETITLEQYNELNESFLKEKNDLLKQKESIENELNTLKEKEQSLHEYKLLVDKHKNFKELTHIMVNELVDYIEVGEKDKTSGEQEVIIHWNF